MSNSGLSVALQDLRNLGIVHKEEIQADSRIFILSEELAELNIGRVRAPESVAVLTALIRLQAEGHTKISGKRIFDSVAAARPEMSRRRMNWLFTKWRGNPNNAALVPEVRLSDRQYDRSHVAIVPEYQNYLSNLLGIRQMLGEDNPAAEAWRQAAREQAKDIAASPDHIARLLQLSKTHAACVNVPRDADWARDLAQFIPPEGIDAMELHRRVVDDQGKNIVYRAFCERLNRLDGIGVMERARLGQAQRPPNLVIKKHTFPKTWTNDAACKRLDPSLFSPLAGPGEVHPKVERQVEAAKSICHGCPVRLPCLRTAIDTREQQDVRGGVWFRRRQETPPQMTRMILDLVHVREGDEDDK